MQEPCLKLAATQVPLAVTAEFHFVFEKLLA